MRDIVWAIDPRLDDLNEVLFRVRQFASSVFEAKGVQYVLETANGLDDIKLNPDQRRDIFLFFKEAITNIVRHSDSKTAFVSLEVTDGDFIGLVRDHGKGLPSGTNESAAKGGGLGLTSIQRRAEQHGGRLEIESVDGGGTQLKLFIPLNRRRNTFSFSATSRRKS
jgi:signal transduction histidine kinase